MEALVAKTPPSTPNKPLKKKGPIRPKTNRIEYDTPRCKYIIDLYEIKG